MNDTATPPIDRKIKILFLAANPSDTQRLRLDQEVRAIDQALRQAEFCAAFDLEQHWAVRASDLQGLLLRLQPDIVHFSGHGSAAGELMLEDANGNARVISQDALSMLFSLLKDNIRVVVLNACYSALQAESISTQIDCVVGMSDAMGDQAAMAFSAAFYQAIAFGRDVRTAYGLACNQVRLEGLAETEVPRLLTPRCDPSQIVLVSAASMPGIINRHAIIDLGPDGMDQFIDKLVTRLGADKHLSHPPTAEPAPEEASRQIAEVVAAERELATQGGGLKPASMTQLGFLAAYRRDYETALDYFRLAAQADPEQDEAFEAIAWLQQSRGMADLAGQDYEAAMIKLTEADEASEKTDPLDPDALASRGFIAKALAQLAEATNRPADSSKYYAKAERLFEGAIRLDPLNPSVFNGLGNVRAERGDPDGAIAAYRQVIGLCPAYAAAHHDLAIAYENQWRADPGHSDRWYNLALESWRTAYELAANDPSFSAEAVVRIGQHILQLKKQDGI